MAHFLNSQLHPLLHKWNATDESTSCGEMNLKKSMMSWVEYLSLSFLAAFFLKNPWLLAYMKNSFIVKSTLMSSLHRWSCRYCGSKTRYVNRRSKSSASSSYPSISVQPLTTAALGGERIPSRAFIYIHSPLQSASGLQHLRSHDDKVVSRAEVTATF